MSECSLLKFFYLAYLSQPSAERFLYRGLRKWRYRAIVEIGIGRTLRTRRLLSVACRCARGEPVRYTGIDLFEARPPQQPAFSLKQAHQQLQFPGVRVQLAPGDPWLALQRLANTLVGTDLLLIGADVDPQSLERAWFFVPRMLHDRSRVFIESKTGDASAFRPLAVEEIRRLAALQQKAQRRAG